MDLFKNHSCSLMLVSNEILGLILKPLLIQHEPIYINSPTSTDRSICLGITHLLRVSKRFHDITEEIAYRYNTFEMWDLELCFEPFIMRLSHFARGNMSKLRLYWPVSDSTRYKHLLEWIAFRTNVNFLEIISVFQEVSIAELQFLDRLAIDEVWFETL